MAGGPILLLLSAATTLLLMVVTLADATYVPGTPGAAWSQRELLIVNAKLRRIYHRTADAPKALRLGFHDCLRYADGSGGCDGCLNWKNVDVRLKIEAHARNISDHHETDNNGLGDIVRTLERIYTEANFPYGAPMLATSLRESGKSRADLWAYAAIVAVEWGIRSNNMACKNHKDLRLRWMGGKGTCVHDDDPKVCKLRLPRKFKFQTGRKDCVEVGNEPYKATKIEKHPSYLVNGRDTVKFFKEEFSFNSRETVAIFGAHTYGTPHFEVSQIPYTWTSRAIFLFNNDYYKSLTGQDRWFIDDDDCNKIGDAFGNRPKSKWIAHTRMTSFNGGPTFWIHHNHACPNCVTNPDMFCCTTKEAQNMCRVDPALGGQGPRVYGQEDGNDNAGCERLRFISGQDEIALNCEMGLYFDFEVDNGVLHGCPGLEIFNKTMSDPNEKRTVWSTRADGNGIDQPDCPKQMVAEPAGSAPAYQVMEEYANDQATWINDFQLAMEKMMANGYTDSDLQLAPMPTTIKCPLNQGWMPPMFCYPKADLDKSTSFKISSAWDELSGKVMTMNHTTGEVSWQDDIPNDWNQIWMFNKEHDMMYSLYNKRPLVFKENVYWRMDEADNPKGAILLDDVTGRALDCFGAKNGHGCVTWTKHGLDWQRFVLTTVG